MNYASVNTNSGLLLASDLRKGSVVNFAPFFFLKVLSVMVHGDASFSAQVRKYSVHVAMNSIFEHHNYLFLNFFRLRACYTTQFRILFFYFVTKSYIHCLPIEMALSLSSLSIGNHMDSTAGMNPE